MSVVLVTSSNVPPSIGAKAVSGVARPQGPGETLGILWPPLAVRPRVLATSYNDPPSLVQKLSRFGPACFAESFFLAAAKLNGLLFSDLYHSGVL
jgi:hypothetical protein